VSGRHPTLISDLGGVVIDFAFERAFAHWAESLGIEVARIDFPYRDATYLAYERGEVGTAEFVSFLARHLDLPLDEAAFLAGWERIFIGVVDEMVDLYRALRSEGVRVVGLTNTNAAHAPVWRNGFVDALAVFDRIYASSEIGARKPDPEAYTHVLRAEGIAASDAVFLDDTPYCVEGARAVGLAAYLYRDPAQARADLLRAGLPA
jgi:glucose-1-phosphatase